MVDLHSHILPGLDDGPEDAGESLSMVLAELNDGVQTIVLTPHFRTDIADPDSFLRHRRKAYELLCGDLPALGVKLLTGAEAAFSPALLEMEIGLFCIEGTNNILIELPPDHYPPLTRKVFYELRTRGITPVIAHVERYPYFLRDPGQLALLIRGGAYAQINAGSLLCGGHTARTALHMLKSNLAHAVATDTHSMKDRPPMLGRAMKLVSGKLGKDTAEYLEDNAERIVSGKALSVPDPG
ncbi:MAG: hypothetical protein LBH95_05550 [Oscillospiraceae bacterium]|jgi:protein-tyrosine phosphatase|nr:hypothetical protein [Oscillospiraceae bacterium]